MTAGTPISWNLGHTNLKVLVGLHGHLKHGVTQRSVPHQFLLVHVTSMNLSLDTSGFALLPLNPLTIKALMFSRPGAGCHLALTPMCENTSNNSPIHVLFTNDRLRLLFIVKLACILKIWSWKWWNLHTNFAHFLYTKMHFLGVRGTRSCIRLHSMGVLDDSILAKTRLSIIAHLYSLSHKNIPGHQG